MRQDHQENHDVKGNGGGASEVSAASRVGSGGGVVLLLSVEEAARALGLGRSKTYELIAAGELEVVHIGRCARVPVDSVETYVERLRWDGGTGRVGYRSPQKTLVMRK